MAGATGTEINQAAKVALDLHNDFRRDHDATPLELDADLCEQAEAYAICIAGGMKAATKDESGLGRNIYKIQTTGGAAEGCDPKEAVTEGIKTWYSYAKDYKWLNPLSSSLNAKLFSQMVWKSSKKMGVGIASRGEVGVKFLTVVVILYSPGGNLNSDERHKENVGRPRGRKYR